MQQPSAVYNAYLESTPSQRAAVIAHNIRRSRFASKAIVQSQHGVVKYYAPRRPVVYRMWFEDLIAESDRIMALPSKRTLDVKQIQQVVARHYGHSWEIMFTSSRKAGVIKPRHVAMYLSKIMTPRSLPDIGRRFGGRDHSTIISAVRKIGRQIKGDAAFAAEVNSLARALGGTIAAEILDIETALALRAA